jgi:hypothetical protein
LLEALSEVDAYLREVPKEFVMTFFHDPTPQRLGDDAASAIRNAINETLEWLCFAHRSVAYRAAELAAELVRALNARSHLTALFCARALLELAGLFHMQLESIMAHGAKLGALAPEDLSRYPHLQESRKRDIASIVIEAWQAIRSVSAKSRFNWLAAEPFGSGNLASNYSGKNLPEHLRQDNVLTAIDKLNLLGPAPKDATLRLYYEMICDFVHPNVGSVAVFVDQAQPAGDNRHEYVIRRTPESPEVTQVVLEVISIPVRESLVTLHADLLALNREYEKLRGKLS